MENMNEIINIIIAIALILILWHYYSKFKLQSLNCNNLKDIFKNEKMLEQLLISIKIN